MSELSSGFHLFKNDNGILKLKLNDNITENLSNLLSFLTLECSPHNIYPETIIYISKGVKLNELLNCYYFLSLANHNKVVIITDYNLKENSYSFFYDRVNFWQNQIENYTKLKNYPPTPPLPYFHKTNYIKKYHPKIITINSFNDFNLLEKTNSNYNYLISINSGMKLDSYLKLKEMIFEIKKKQKVRIRTEFIL